MELALLRKPPTLFRPLHNLHSQPWCFLWELDNVCCASIFTASCRSVYQKHFHLKDSFQDFNWGNLCFSLYNKPFKILSLNELGHCNAHTQRGSHLLRVACVWSSHIPGELVPDLSFLDWLFSQGAYAENSLLEVIRHSWHLWQP